MTYPGDSAIQSMPGGMLERLSMKTDLTPLVSVVIPTYREAENLPVLIPQVARALERSGMSAEILVVDDNSPDETVAVCEQLSQEYPVRLLVRTQDRGLSSAVVHGLRHARGSVLLVMDADLSHPPEKVPELVAAILEQQGDFVIGSRYVAGGTTDDDWSLFRWINSQVATWMSRGLTTARDPMAGFFALSRQTFEEAEHLNPIGYKIGLELMVKCGCRKVAEVPIHFKDRLHGESKLSLKEQLNYIRHLGRLYRFQLGKWFTPLCFGLVGASGVVIDLVIFSLLLLVGSFPMARAGAIWGAMTWNYIWNRRLTFADRKHESWIGQYLKFCGSCLLGASVSWGISTLIWAQAAGWLQYPQLAALAGILGGVLLNYVLSNHLVFRQPEPKLSAFLGWDSEIVTAPSAASRELLPPGIKPGSVKLESAKYLAGSQPIAARSRVDWSDRWMMWGVVLLSLCVTAGTWFRAEIDGLDQAHNVLTSVYFHDLFRDLPWNDLAGYTYDYQRQYPALGLMFWPPLFHAVAGGLMLPFGPNLMVVHLLLGACSLLLGLAMYRALRISMSPGWAGVATALTLTAPVVFRLQNTVMLEIPSLALALLAVLLYMRVTARGKWAHAGEALGIGACLAAIAYAKQPAVFVLLGMMIDLLVNHRALLKSRLTWLCAATTGCLLIPLAAFTLKFGKVNLAQSFGNQGNIYVEHHRVAERWSIEGWTYYLQLLPSQLPWILLAASVFGMGLMLLNGETRRKHGIWLWAGLAWYLMFSYFDNKQIRFVAYAVPFLAVAVVVAGQWMTRQKHWSSAVLLCALWAFCGWNLANGWQAPQRGYHLMASLLTPPLQSGRPVNVAYFGEDHHLFTAQLRLLDSQRQHAMLRGDDLLEASAGDLQQALEDYRVEWFLVDPDLPLGKQVLAQMADQPELFTSVTETVQFDNGEKAFPVRLFTYTGPLAETPRTVPLHSQLLGIAATTE